MSNKKWKDVKAGIQENGHTQRLRQIEYIPATKASNNVSGMNMLLNQKQAILQQRQSMDNGQSVAPKTGRFSAAVKMQKADKRDQDKNSESQALTVTAAKKSGSLFVPSGVLQSLKWKRLSTAGPGLFNQGNTCFLNSRNPSPKI